MFAAHIHEAPVGEPGDIVVPLFEGVFAGTDAVSDCVFGVNRDLIKDIRKHPRSTTSTCTVRRDSRPGRFAGS